MKTIIEIDAVTGSMSNFSDVPDSACDIAYAPGCDTMAVCLGDDVLFLDGSGIETGTAARLEIASPSSVCFGDGSSFFISQPPPNSLWRVGLPSLHLSRCIGMAGDRLYARLLHRIETSGGTCWIPGAVAAVLPDLNVVVKVTIGRGAEVMAGTGTAGFSISTNPLRCQMSSPGGIASDPSGATLVVSDTGNGVIRVFEAVPLRHKAVIGLHDPDLKSPGRICTDGESAYVVDGGSRIVSVDLASGVTSNIADTGGLASLARGDGRLWGLAS